MSNIRCKFSSTGKHIPGGYAKFSCNELLSYHECIHCNARVTHEDVSLKEWLAEIKEYIQKYDLICSGTKRLEFVKGLFDRDLLYHFDDAAVDCLSDAISKGMLTLEDANLIQEITNHYYDEDMFRYAGKLINGDVVTCYSDLKDDEE